MPPLEIQKLKEQENALNPYSSDYTDAKIKAVSYLCNYASVKQCTLKSVAKIRIFAMKLNSTIRILKLK